MYQHLRLYWQVDLHLECSDRCGGVGVTTVLVLLTVIFFYFVGQVEVSNLTGIYTDNLFLPFGVVFAFIVVHSMSSAGIF